MTTSHVAENTEPTGPALLPSDKGWPSLPDRGHKGHISPSQIWSWHDLGPEIHQTSTLSLQVNSPPPALMALHSGFPPSGKKQNILFGFLFQHWSEKCFQPSA